MNVLFFAARRADLCVLRYARRLLGEYGLTPARFDLLYFLSTQEIAPNQTEIAQALCVSRPVITRMVRSLVDLGLVRRYRLGRYRLVELTKFGRMTLRHAIVHVRKPVARDVPERFGAAKRGVIDVLMEWEGHFLWWQQIFGKDTWLLYPYDHPDD